MVLCAVRRKPQGHPEAVGPLELPQQQDRATDDADVVVEPSVEAQAPVDRTAQENWARKLASAAWEGEAEVVKDMLQGSPPEGPAESPLNILIDHGAIWPNISAACAAACKGHLDVLELLLEARADVNLQCQRATQWDGAFTLTERDTALCFAVREGHTPCVEALLAGGADPNIRCESEYIEGAVEWGEDDDGSEQMIYGAVDVAHMARLPELAELLQRHGGTRLAGGGVRKAAHRIKVSQGSRMGA